MLEINLIASKIHEFSIDHGKARLTRGLGDDTRDQIASHHSLDRILFTHQLQHIHVFHIADLCDDMIRLGAAIGIVSDCQHCFDHIGIGIAVFGWQYNDGLCDMWTRDLEIVRVDGTTVSTNNARLLL